MSAVKTLLTAVLLAGAALTVPAGATASPATVSPASSPRGFDNCWSGYFCLYSDWNGGGTVCRWPGGDDDSVKNTQDDCSFIRNKQNVRSVQNNTSHRKQYYTGTNFNDRVGSTGSFEGGNLSGDYRILSFEPQR